MSHSHSKTPGGAGASEKFLKQQAEKHGSGASNAAGHTEEKAPGEAPVASDSGSTNVGVRAGQNQPGEKGISGVPVDSAPTTGNANQK
ncbi:hypothetical protein LTR95_006045 [Oleoguttula sp. CCFEE 5521]|uniref:Uncharacterized protein n=1 Tax=Cryoendolithus antarcticus TaxID=1507870 RepID=A0A1V8T8H4_9PEZI|nr:hypothetical protein B0A48_07347 [Cryoendolithus antarcticus]OQO22534.1 hypothetical protein B0A51_09685 [Rachicladosporium sp. CCFEE 5018]OQO28368.1 hypothetical protein B0A51_04645 [Rachicladosporium sp. CCFEE 5018]